MDILLSDAKLNQFLLANKCNSYRPRLQMSSFTIAFNIKIVNNCFDDIIDSKANKRNVQPQLPCRHFWMRKL